MNYKLPSINIIAASLFFAWTIRVEFLRAIALPTLALVMFWAIGANYSSELPSFMWLPYLLGYGLSFAFLAVTCHRLILVGESDRHRSFKGRPGYRELRFLMWVVVIYAAESILQGITWHLAKGVVGRNLGDPGGWVKQVASIPALYILARLSLAFPAAAIDRRAGLKWSWIRTRGNGWRIFVVVGLFPWVTELLIGLVWREDASVLEETVLSIFAIIGMAIGIIALSFVYKELAKQFEGGDSFPAGEAVEGRAFDVLPTNGRRSRLDIAAKVAVALAIVYLFVGSLGSFRADCTSERIASVISPDGAYRAELHNQTCRDERRQQGLVLDIVRTTTPNTIRSFPLSRTPASDVELVWTSGKSLMVRHAGSLDSADLPALVDGVQLVFEKTVSR